MHYRKHHSKSHTPVHCKDCLLCCMHSNCHNWLPICMHHMQQHVGFTTILCCIITCSSIWVNHTDMSALQLSLALLHTQQHSQLTLIYACITCKALWVRNMTLSELPQQANKGMLFCSEMPTDSAVLAEIAALSSKPLCQESGWKSMAAHLAG
jgi:hypothetical protein